MSEQPPTTDSPESPDAELTRLRAENAGLRAQLDQLAERIRELEARLAKDSHNSSKPPSSDGFKKPPPRTQRQRSGNQPGGQKGHPGATRALVDTPDATVVVPLAGRCTCGREQAEITAEIQPERRQVADLVVRREVVEYRTVAGVCACGQAHRSAFPAGVDAPVQYGPGLRAFAVYLTQYQLLPLRRAADLVRELAGVAISPATVLGMVREAAERLAPQVEAIGQALVQAAVAHVDETGMRVAGKRHWLHVMCTATLTRYFVHAKRGREAVDAFGLLMLFHGTLIRDHWVGYDFFSGPQGFCNAHHLRELTAVAETYPGHTWPERMIALLCAGKQAAERAREAGLTALPAAELADFRHRYDTLLAHAQGRHPIRKGPPGSRRRVKQTPACNLIIRLKDRRDDVLRFLADLRVPFDNNQAERDIRMPKLKQKVSGCFRSVAGAAAFATVRSYLSTLRKQSIDSLQALVMTFEGNPPMPQLG